jgi:phage host-nuclease inhibitor protein Gam
MKARIKKEVEPAITTREAAVIALGEIAKWQAKEQKLTGEMNVEIERVKRTYAADLADLNTKISARFTEIKQWAVANKELFVDPKSITTTHGTFGFKIGNYELCNVRGWPWKRVIEKLVDFAQLSAAKKKEGIEADPESFEERIVAYLKFSPEINKAAILADRATFRKEELLWIGCEIDRQETFYVEPKLETTETRLQEKEAA